MPLNHCLYRADGEIAGHKWTPSIFMPRALSRITLKVIEVRVQRVQDINVEDTRAEGVDYVANYHKLWDSLNAKRGFGWDLNPWVWVIHFKRL
jgi:hypothetical protein